MLFHIPLSLGVCFTVLNVFVIMALERHGFRKLEALVISLMLVTGVCLALELMLSRPDLAAVGSGMMPSAQILTDPAMLYIAIGIVGATVMPHNLYLHSALVQTRRFRRDVTGKREAIRFATIDSVIALSIAFLINAAILVLAASTFHVHGRTDVADISEAYRLLSPMMGVGAASLLFGVALLASGQNSAVTGVLAGQVVMEGFTTFRVPAPVRRTISRLIAIVPAATVALLYGDGGVTRLLIAGQVVLSLQLPFAMIPLVRLTSDRATMGPFVNRLWLVLTAWIIVAIIMTMNVRLIVEVVW